MGRVKSKVRRKSAVPPAPNQMSFEIEQPVWDPMTSSFVDRETGLEPGPSNSGGGHKNPPNHDFNKPGPLSAKVS